MADVGWGECRTFEPWNRAVEVQKAVSYLKSVRPRVDPIYRCFPATGELRAGWKVKILIELRLTEMRSAHPSPSLILRRSHSLQDGACTPTPGRGIPTPGP